MKQGLGDRLKYAFDKVMSRGLPALIGLLAVVTLIFICLIALVVEVFGLFPTDQTLDFGEAFWLTMLRTLDPGTMGGDTGPGFRIAMLIVTLTGLVLVASLIGIVANAFNEKVEDLRKGRSRVIEKDHTLILGWNRKINQVVSELAIANESRRRARIVVLADRDKVEMEDELKAHLPARSKTQIIVRTGDPMSVADLALTGLDAARSIIVLSPDDADEPDNFSIKTALAILNNPNRKPEAYKIVGEIKEEQNVEAAELVGGTEAKWIRGDDLISRLIVQTSRQRGLSAVYNDLLDFGGAELYLTDAASLAGESFGNASLSIPQGALVGVMSGDEVALNPSRDRVLQGGDQLIILAEDDDRLEFGPRATWDESVISISRAKKRKPERTLILGSNATLPVVLAELDSSSASGSTVVLVEESATAPMVPLLNTTLKVISANPSSRTQLDLLRVDTFDHIIVLANREKSSAEQSDARTLLILLNLRAMKKNQPHNINIVSEMLNDKNRELAQSHTADDFIVSEQLVGNMMTMVSENIDMHRVLSEVISSEGPQLRLNPASWYVKTNSPVDFNTISEAALRRGESALGYRMVSPAAAAQGSGDGVVLNPVRTDLVVLGEEDSIVVLGG
jgi:voltage-gated potassium channel Kch/K+/H+ antiporter YhaU regulatory subunit KhtT